MTSAVLIITALIGLVTAQCAVKPEPVTPLELDATLPITLSSPGYNYTHSEYSRYPDNTRCEWVITTENPGMELELSFADFSLESCPDCSCDFVQVYNGSEVDESQLLMTWCTDIAPPTLTADGRELYVVFDTNSDLTENTGFLARAGFPLESVACDSGPEIINDTSPGYIYSGNYPINYDNNVQCTWKFEAPIGRRVEVWFSEFDVEECCNCDWLEVYNGETESSRRMAHWYGADLPMRITSAGRHMFWKFNTDESQRFKGFLAFYAFV